MKKDKDAKVTKAALMAQNAALMAIATSIVKVMVQNAPREERDAIKGKLRHEVDIALLRFRLDDEAKGIATSTVSDIFL